MKIKLFYIVIFACSNCIVNATTYYINATIGNDKNLGTTSLQPFKTVSPISNIQLLPGDSVLFATGQMFQGMLSLINTKGATNKWVVVSSYPYQGNTKKPILDAGENLNAILIKDASFIAINNIEVTGIEPYLNSNNTKEAMRCGILVLITKNENFESIRIEDIVVHDVYFNKPGFPRSAAETKSANGTQSYGWGIRIINNTLTGKLANVHILKAVVYNVSHTGIKCTATKEGITNLTIEYCKVYKTGGPGMQFSGVYAAHIHHNSIAYSGSTADSRNWGRGSGLWTWGCSNFIIEHNRFEYANGPGDSAGIHIDFNCKDVVVQYNFSANNAGGFCEILGNNFNCTYRYNISVNDGFREKGVNGAFQEGKIFWLSGYVGNNKPNTGPFNSYFYNNTIYVAANIIPKIAISSSANGILIANNIFHFEADALQVAGDQKKVEQEENTVATTVINNNLFLHKKCWPANMNYKDIAPVFGDAGYANKGGIQILDYLPSNKKLVLNKGIVITPIPNDTIGLKVGLQVQKDILGNTIKGLPDMGAIEL